jgi:hypothetical protein
MKKIFSIATSLLLIVGTMFGQNFPGASGNPSVISRPGGHIYAPAFFWSGRVISGNQSTGSQSIIIAGGSGATGGVTVQDGTTIPLATVFNTLTPLIVDWGQGAAEYITPTTASVGTCPAGNLGVGGSSQCVTITATFANTHGQSAVVVDGTFGLQSAVNYAQQLGGGIVNIDGAWAQMVGTSTTTGAPAGGANALIAAVTPFASVAIQDLRAGSPPLWAPVSANATFLAVPATLTAATAGIAVNGAGGVAGLYTNANPYQVCISYVDIMGNEGPCSLTFSLTPASGTTNSIGFTAPAASAGAVGWVPYISLTNGTYALAYRVPLTSTVCTLTKVETIISACALTNTTYSQIGSGAIVSALTVNTARLAYQLGAASTTADIVPNSAAHTVYLYAPGGNANPGLGIGSYAPFTVTTAAATTVPAVLGTVQLPPGFMNFVGQTIRICGHATQAAAGSTASIENIQFFWDADGSNTTGAGVQIGNGIVSVVTLVTANADTYNFCGTLRTTVAGSGVTAGSIQAVTGWSTVTSGPAGTQATGAGVDTSSAATASLNLAGEGRIDVVYNHTSNTDANGLVLQNMTVEVLN